MPIVIVANGLPHLHAHAPAAAGSKQNVIPQPYS
jgi:hypothetical protein